MQRILFNESPNKFLIYGFIIVAIGIVIYNYDVYLFDIYMNDSTSCSLLPVWSIMVNVCLSMMMDDQLVEQIDVINEKENDSLVCLLNAYLIW